ncbi:MAG: 16S rRNA (cytidine(1402)-2'-O)-methyltransferase, partial [Candidatus Eremiobacteraeota bacterium]|nr:16S rRNA (cytidine(1402)-2'-O)-methyltransferase [Candidatus Eremiobacteraeota bacterium]
MPLLFVPTPLGNLRDVTLRALDTLKAADLIVAEDTRVARKLLTALAIGTKELRSYREQNARVATAAILERAAAGTVAVVTDAGTPGVSDPGVELVAAARRAGIPVEVLPGPSAVVPAAVLSGFPLDRFTFAGFVPRAQTARKRALAAALESGTTTIWYESPHRVRATLRSLDELAPDRPVFVLREYTKRFEQQVLAPPAEAARALPDPVRGEIVLVTPPGSAPQRAPSRATIDAQI